MNTHILSKLATFAVALMMNGLIIAGVNYRFNDQVRQHTAEIALARANDNGLRDAQESMNLRVCNRRCSRDLLQRYPSTCQLRC
jgi:hypothetical protein